MKKVGLVSVRNYNYGSILQAYALQQELFAAGIDNELIYYKKRNVVKQALRIFNLPLLMAKTKDVWRVIEGKTNPKLKPIISGRNRAFSNFLKDNFVFTPCLSGKKQLVDYTKKFDAFILGSDQVWNPMLLGGDYYTLTWVDSRRPKGIKYNHYLIGSRLEHTLNRELSSITDFQDCGSLLATAKFINHIKKINPDIIHIHDIAGYYLNLDLFFGFLKKYKKPVIWTFHCCWAYTGRCIYYDYIKCNKWQTECSHCPQDRNSFPKHLFADFSKHNYLKKKNLFLSLDDLTIVTPSYWLEGEVKKSFFKEKRVVTIHNGINLSDFYPDNSMMLKEKYGITDKIILGVAAVWSNRKGLSTFIELERKLPKGYKIVLIGLNDRQIKELPKGILGLPKTFSVDELRNWYSCAEVFVNPTMEEVLGLVNIEAQACGTPVITYDTGGSVECVSNDTGFIVEQNNVHQLICKIETICEVSKSNYKLACITQSKNFDKDKKYMEYVELYEKIFNQSRRKS